MGDERRLVSGRTMARLSAELVVIVAGVLIALAAENGWGSLQDRRFEVAALESLRAELEAAEAQLTEYVTRDSTIMRHADRILNRTAMPADSLALRVSRMFNTIPDEVRLLTLDELVGTGRLHLFRSRELRLALLDFDSKARTLAGYNDQMEAQWNTVARPVLYARLNWDDLAAQFPSVFGEPRAEGALSPEGRVVTFDRELRAAVRDRRAFAAVHVARVGEVLDALDHLRELTAQPVGR